MKNQAQSSHKTFNLQSVLLARYARAKVPQNLWEWPTNTWFNLRPTLQGDYALHCLDGQEQNMTGKKKLNKLITNDILLYS